MKFEKIAVATSQTTQYARFLCTFPFFSFVLSLTSFGITETRENEILSL